MITTTELEKKLIAYLIEVPIDLGGDIAAVTLTQAKAGEIAKGVVDILKKGADGLVDKGHFLVEGEERRQSISAIKGYFLVLEEAKDEDQTLG